LHAAYYGCELCQKVWSWIQEIQKQEINTDLEQDPNDPQVRKELISEVQSILNLDTQNIKEFFKNTPMNRAKPWAHKRNAILIAVHFDLKELKQDILNLKLDKTLPDFSAELIDWASQKM